MNKALWETLGVIGGTLVSMATLYGLIMKLGSKWFGRNARKIKVLEEKAKIFEEQLHDLQGKYNNSEKQFKQDIDTLEHDYKEIFKILLNRK